MQVLVISGRLIGDRGTSTSAQCSRLTPTSEESSWQTAFPAPRYSTTHLLVPAEATQARQEENDDNDDDDDDDDDDEVDNSE